MSRSQQPDILGEPEVGHHDLLAVLPAAILVLNGSAIVFANASAAALLGAPAVEHVIGLDIATLVSPVQFTAAMREVEEHLAAGDATRVPVVTPFRRLDGAPVLVEMVPAKLRDDGSRILLALRDVTEERRLQSELTASEDMARFLADHATSLLLRANSLQRVVYASPFAGALLELSPDDLLGAPLSSLFLSDDRSEVAAAVAEAVSTGVATPREVRALAAAVDHSVWVELTVRAVIGAHEDSRAVEYHVTLTNVEERRANRVALASSERRMRALVEAAPVGIFEMDRRGVQRFANPRLLDIVEADSDEAAKQMAWFRMVHPDDLAGLSAAWLRSIAENRPFQEEFRLITAAGRTRWLKTDVVPVLDADERVEFYLGTVEDTTDRRESEHARLQAMEIFRSVFAAGPNAMVLTSTAEFPPRVLLANDAYAELTRRSPEEIVGLDIYATTHPDDLESARAGRDALLSGERDRDVIEIRQLDGLGQWRWYSLTRSLVRANEGSTEFMMAHLVDVTERRLADETVNRLALTDPLTGLSNRRHFLQHLSGAPARHSQSLRNFAVVFLDLDRFKTINDELGHHAGDRLLEEVGAAITTAVRPGDLVARLGGDEFAIIIEHVTEGDVGEIAERLCSTLSFPRELPNGEAVVVTASIGCALAAPGETDAEALLQRADAAMYRAKRLGRDRWVLDPH